MMCEVLYVNKKDIHACRSQGGLGQCEFEDVEASW